MKTNVFYADDAGHDGGVDMFGTTAAKAMKTVVCVDDDRLLLRLLESRLDEHDYAVVGAENGQSGLRAAISLNPDVIVLDAMMPGIDGFEVLRRLKSQPQTREIPVLMLSALRHPKDMETGLSLGAAVYLAKPIALDDLVSHLDRIVATHGRPH